MTDPYNPDPNSPPPATGTSPAAVASPATPPVPRSFTGRTRLGASELIRVGIVVVSLVVLVASAAVATGASPAPSSGAPASAPAASNAPGGDRGPSWGRGGLFGGLGRGGPFGGFFGLPGGPFGGPGGGGGPVGFGAITIAKIDGADVSLKTDDGWQRTVTVTDKTQIQVGSRKGSLADLKVGDAVTLRETKNADGSYTITLIVVRVPTIAGTVTAIAAGGFTLKQRDGTSKSVAVSGATTYLIDGATGAKSDLSVGARVQVEGTAGSGDDFAASVVHIVPDVRTGTVTATTSSTITIKTRDGSTQTIHVDSSTTFRVAGAATATIADVKTGMALMAAGTTRADGSLDAVSVLAGQFKLPRIRIPDRLESSPPSS